MARIGRPAAIATRLTIDVGAIVNDRLEIIAAEIMNGADPSAAVAAWQASINDAQSIDMATWQSRVQAELTGRLFVADIELPRALALDDDIGTAFAMMPYRDAIEYMRQRGIISADELAALEQREMVNAQVLRPGITRAVAERILRLLEKEVGPTGRGLEAFLAELQSVPVANPVLERIYTTTTAEAYGAGRYRQQTDAAVIDAGLEWEYVTVLDARVRPTHRALHGARFPVGDLRGQRVYPPNGWRCRCAMIVSEKARRPRDVNDDAIGAALDPGFDGPPLLA